LSQVLVIYSWTYMGMQFRLVKEHDVPRVDVFHPQYQSWIATETPPGSLAGMMSLLDQRMPSLPPGGIRV
jgi:hypothetical protein